MPVGAKMNFGTAFDECAIAQQLHIQYGSIPQEDQLANQWKIDYV